MKTNQIIVIVILGILAMAMLPMVSFTPYIWIPLGLLMIALGLSINLQEEN